MVPKHDVTVDQVRIAHRRTRWAESVFSWILHGLAWITVALIVCFCLTLVVQSLPAIRDHGFGFVFSDNWDPVKGRFGAIVFLAGTLLTSVIALLIAVPFSLAIAIFLAEIVKSGWFSYGWRIAIELLAGIPSIVYGFWGMAVVVPAVRTLQMAIGVPPYGVGAFTAAIILAIMIIPFAASLARDVIFLVPNEIREAAVALGATPVEVIRHCVLPYARSGIIAGILLAFGRALGETMAVTMVIGNSNMFPETIFSPTNTMASIIANEFSEATSSVYVSSLVEIGLLLFLVSATFSMIGRLIIRRFRVR